MEICLNGEWGTICDDRWGTPDAIVACRQLNLNTDCKRNLSNYATKVIFAIFFSSSPDAVDLISYGGGSDPIHYAEFQCIGNETRLANCTANDSPQCDHGKDAGVRCPSGEQVTCYNCDSFTLHIL